MRASILLMLITVFFGCNSNLKFEGFIGKWQNSDEGCAIKLNEDSTFKAINIPLDVENDYYLTFNKEFNDWSGKWELAQNKIRLNMNDSYYTLWADESYLYIKLSNESGGDYIYFERNK